MDERLLQIVDKLEAREVDLPSLPQVASHVLARTTDPVKEAIQIKRTIGQALHGTIPSSPIRTSHGLPFVEPQATSEDAFRALLVVQVL